MALTGKLVGDFSSFTAAVDKATTKLKDMQSGASQVQQQLNRMGDSFSGTRVVAQANLATKAVEDIGGASKLTATEQQRLNAVLSEAIEKYAALGQTAPPQMVALAEATKKSTAAVDELKNHFDVKDAIEHPIAAATQVMKTLAESLGPVGTAATIVVGTLTAVGAVLLDLTERAGAVGGKLNDMALKTGITVPSLSRLSFAAQAAGTDIETLSNVIYKLDVQAIDSPEKFAKGMEHLGLKTKDFLALDPYSRLTTLAGALNNTADTAVRNAAGMELMGKQFKEVIAPLEKLQHALQETSGISVWSAEQARNAEEFQVQMKVLELQAANVGVAIGRELLPAANELLSWLRTTTPVVVEFLAKWTQTGQVLTGAGNAFSYASAALSLFRGNLNASIDSSQKAGQTTSEYAKDLQDQARNAENGAKFIASWGEATKLAGADAIDAAVGWKDLTASNEEHLAATKKSQEQMKLWKQVLDDVNSAGVTWQDTLKGIDSSVEKNAEALLTAGVKAESVAKYYGLTATQIAAVQKQLDFLNKALEDTNKEFDIHNRIMGLIAPRYTDLHDQITGVDHVTENLTSTFFDSGVAVLGFANQAAYTAQQTERMRAGLDQARKSAEEFKAAIGQAFANFPETLARAFEGGGSLTGAFESLGAQLGGTVSKKFGESFRFGVKEIDGVEIGQSLGGSIASGLLSGGVGAALGLGISALTKFISGIGGPSKNELAARDAFNKEYTSTADALKKVGDAYAKLGIAGAQQDLEKLFDATHISADAVAAAMQTINDKIAAGQAAADKFATALGNFSQNGAQNFNDIAIALEDDRSSLEAVGAQALTTYATLVAGGASSAKALAAIAPGLDSLKKSYADLGLNVNDVGLNALFMQATILKGNPALVAGIDALASQFKAMDDLGLLNVQTFGQMQATGEAMYTRLQSAAEAAGGSTKDALLPMQQWLHQAATEATKLGVPLDDATQLLIDQSKELGIWKEQGIDPMIDGMNKLIDAVKELVNQLTNSLSPAITNLPSVPGPSAASSGGATQNFAGGGRVIQFPGTSGGTDSQIIRATPGEAVLTPDQQQALLGGGGGPIEITLINRMDGVEMSRTVTRIQSRDLAIRRKLGAA